MELTVEAFSLDHALKCIEIGVDNLILGNELFANRLSYSFNESEIANLVNKRKTTKIWIKVNNFFFEHEIDRLEMYLRWLSSLEIEKVIFQDYAVAQINFENNLNLNLHYNPETLVTSYGQFDFFKENNIDSVFVARELMYNELQEICENKNGMKIEIQAFGYGFIMHSRWKLITNYEKHYNYHLNKDHEFIKIKEHLRKYPNLLFEDNQGTHMLTGYIIDLSELLLNLYEINVDYLNLNFLNTDNNYAIEITKIYNILLKDVLSNKKISLNQINIIKELSSKYLLSQGFLGGTKHILHLAKDEVDNE